jgi:hypothetical protein
MQVSDTLIYASEVQNACWHRVTAIIGWLRQGYDCHLPPSTRPHCNANAHLATGRIHSTGSARCAIAVMKNQQPAAAAVTLQLINSRRCHGGRCKKLTVRIFKEHERWRLSSTLWVICLLLLQQVTGDTTAPAATTLTTPAMFMQQIAGETTAAAAAMAGDINSTTGDGIRPTAGSFSNAVPRPGLLSQHSSPWVPRVLESPLPKYPRLYASMASPAPALPKAARPAAAAALRATAAVARSPQGISMTGVPGLALEDRILLARMLGHVRQRRRRARLYCSGPCNAA